MQDCVSGRVPPRLVISAQCCPGDRWIQLVFEWEAPWPCKYVIECHDGPYILARSDRLDGGTVREFLSNALSQAGNVVSTWYELVLSRLRAEGGDS